MAEQTQATANWLNRTNAVYLAQVIEDYWGRQGYRVTVTVDQIPRETPNGEALWQIRSDLINGLPRDYSNGPLRSL